MTLDLTDAIPADLIDADAEIAVSEAELRSRGDGFDTASIKGSLPPLDIGELLSGITIADIPEALAYGFWGEHGAAGLVVVDGPFSGRVNGIPFSGDMKVVVPFAFGDVSDTSPAGAGGASWSGVAEVVALRTFRRQEGTVTLTIPALLDPVLSVGIDVSGNPIGKSGWTDIPLEDGHFVFGEAGKDYLEGNFHGVDHGVFDTDNFTGAFGAKREEPGE